jgi:hypothetical protein
MERFGVWDERMLEDLAQDLSNLEDFPCLFNADTYEELAEQIPGNGEESWYIILDRKYDWTFRFNHVL